MIARVRRLLLARWPFRAAAVLVLLAVVTATAVAASRLGSPDEREDRDARARALAAQRSTSFKSRPDLRPPKVEVYARSGDEAPGAIFVAPKAKSKSSPSTGRLILDDAGQPIWFARDDKGERTNDFRVQEYQGKPVLTWWEGKTSGGHGFGEGVIADTSYRVIARVKAKAPYKLDMHEFRLTSRGTALVIIYHPTRRDLRSVGGPRNGRVMDNIIQEIDVKTGKVLFSWHALGNIGLKESYRPRSEDKGEPWDYFHANSVDVDRDGNYIISARYSNSVTKISRRSGRIVWRLGGKRSDFRMGKGTRVSLAHDALWVDRDTLRIFDNSSKDVRDRSRVVTLDIDFKRKRVRLAEDVRHPDKVLAATQGNAQRLTNGHLFVEWGSQGRVSEFDGDGKLLYDAEMADGFSSYRGYRSPWEGHPTDQPAAVAERRADGTTAVYASWNGATEVARWRVLAGGAPLGEAARQGFETQIAVPGAPASVTVQALDASGQVIGTSAPVGVK